MKFLRASGAQLIGLFVADWVQSAVIVAIVAGGWILVSRVGLPGVLLLVVLLAGQLVWFARAEAKR